ncbi:glycosyltransferase [Methylobacterium sp.]|uniref:glycosyltransferase n=1 Tax=Methylobacterium sp. TaxID=409 RepID=UPI00262884C9|nr:glycosyltransferase [Methylobacterium sp.]
MSATTGVPPFTSAERFGHDALGPIMAEFSLRLWLALRFFPHREDATVLFCARGGLRLKQVYERFLARTGLPSPIRAETLMVSRLVAARTCVTEPGEALLSELGREFAGRPMAEVAFALAQRPGVQLSAHWDAPFEAGRFVRLLRGADSGADLIRQAVADQDALFRRHLQARTGGREHVILCDTGLYGSTVRLLRDGIPDRHWLCLQFARSNYKRLATPHFDCTLGLSVQSDTYKPWDRRTAALRFWQLIEAVLEPNLPSVRTFANPGPNEEPRSNLEIPDWQARLGEDDHGLFTGLLAYLDRLDGTALARIEDEAVLGWRRLRRAVVWPGPDDIATLSLPDRSRDFGRSERVTQFASGSSVRARRAMTIRDSLWREGAIMRMFPRTGCAGLLAIELVQTGRALRAATRGRLGGAAVRGGAPS